MTEQNNTTADERYCCDCIHNEVCRWCPHDRCDFKETLKAESAEPVKHGRWEYDHTIGGMKHYHCTNCKNSGNECIADENEILWWEFCPRCSARMDLKDGDSDDQT